MAMSPRLLRPKAGGALLLLDVLKGAIAAYSLRKLRTAYTSAVVRVRRSSDNAEANFTAAEVSGGSLASWVGANDGFAVTWFDQSGNGYDVTQSTSGAQPRIVLAGVVDTSNAKPTLVLNGSQFMASGTVTAGSQPTTGSVVGAITGGGFRHFYDFTSARQTIFDDGNGKACYFAGSAISSSVSITTQKHIVGIFNGASSQLRVNAAVASSGNPGANGYSGAFRIGAFSSQSSGFMTGTIQEVVIWPSSLTASVSTLETNVNNHYKVY